MASNAIKTIRKEEFFLRKILNLTVRRSLIRRRELTMFIGKSGPKTEQLQLVHLQLQHLQLNNRQLDWDINRDSLKLGRSDWDVDTSHHNQHSFAAIASRQAQRPAAQEAARSLQPRHWHPCLVTASQATMASLAITEANCRRPRRHGVSDTPSQLAGVGRHRDNASKKVNGARGRRRRLAGRSDTAFA